MIQDVYADCPKRMTVSGRVSEDCFNYFFRNVLPGERGPRQAMIAKFFQAFHEACVLNGIAPVWDETNEDRVNEVLQRINFVVQQRTAVASRRKGKNE